MTYAQTRLRLIQFAELTLSRLENDKEWGAETLDGIAADANFLQLSTHNETGHFKRLRGEPEPFTPAEMLGNVRNLLGIGLQPDDPSQDEPETINAALMLGRKLQCCERFGVATITVPVEGFRPIDAPTSAPPIGPFTGPFIPLAQAWKAQADANKKYLGEADEPEPRDMDSPIELSTDRDRREWEERSGQ